LQSLILHYEPLIKETDVVTERNIKPRTSTTVTQWKVSKAGGYKNKGQWRKIGTQRELEKNGKKADG
jgi:hypothetical protein